MAEDKYNNEQNIRSYYALKPLTLGFITPLLSHFYHFGFCFAKYIQQSICA